MDPELLRALADLIMPHADDAESFQRDLAMALTEVRHGAPPDVRGALSVMRGMDSKMHYLRERFGDVRPYGRSNFVYLDEDGTPTIVDAKGIRGDLLGDVIDAGPGTAQFIGGTIGAGFGMAGGAAAGQAIAPGVGGFPGALAGSAAGAGIVGSGFREIYERAGRGIGGLEDPRPPARQMRDAIVAAGADAAGQFVGDRYLGPALGAAARRLGLTRAPPPPAPSARAARIAADEMDVPLTPRQLAHGRGPRSASEQAFSRTGPGSRTLDDIGRQQEEALEAARQGIAARVGAGAPSPQDAVGSRASELVRQMSGQVRGRIQMLDEVLVNQVGRETPIKLHNLNQLRNELIGEIQRAPGTYGESYAPALRKINSILGDADKTTGTVPFDVFQRARSQVGEMGHTSPLQGYDAGSAAFKRVYRAMSDDLGAAVSEIGDDAVTALKMHDEWITWARSKAGREINLAALEDIVRTDKVGAIHRSLMSEAGGDARQILGMRNALREFDMGDSWDYVAGEIWRSVGTRPSTGEWSPKLFVQQWKRMSPAAKQAIFGGTELAESLGAMDNMARVADAITQGGGFASGGTPGGFWDMIAGFRPKKMAMGIAQLSRLKARLYQSPRYLQWVSVTLDALRKAPNTKPSMLARLAAIIAQERDQEIAGFLTEMHEALQLQSSPFTLPR